MVLPSPRAIDGNEDTSVQFNYWIWAKAGEVFSYSPARKTEKFTLDIRLYKNWERSFTGKSEPRNCIIALASRLGRIQVVQGQILGTKKPIS